MRFILFVVTLATFGQQIDYVRQVKNKPLTDVRNYGAVCDGNNINTAVLAAIADGKTSLYLPAGCKWIPDSSTIPAGLHIVGENWETSLISSSDPSITGNWLSMGSKVLLENVGIRHRFCSEAANPTNTLKTCPVGIAQNISDSTVIMNNWAYVPLWMNHGPTNGAANDVPGPQILQRSYGDGFYSAVTAQGIAYRAEVKADDGGGGFGMLALVESLGSPSGAGIYIKNQSTNSNSSALTIEHTNAGKGIVFTDIGTSTTGGDEITDVITKKTSGGFLNIYHADSAYSGNIFTLNVGNGTGAFTGKVFDYAVAGSTKFSIESTGKVYQAGVTYANLGTPGNGTFVYCTDCTVGATCSGSGSGAWAFRSAASWKCPF